MPSWDRMEISRGKGIVDVGEFESCELPLLSRRGGAKRRGGCSRDLLEQPPRLRGFGGFATFLDRAATPPVQEGQFVA